MGNHETLLGMRGEYYRLYMAQRKLVCARRQKLEWLRRINNGSRGGILPQGKSENSRGTFRRSCNGQRSSGCLRLCHERLCH